LSVIVSLGVAGVVALMYAAWQYTSEGFPRARVDRSTVRHLMVDGSPILVMGLLLHTQLYLETVLLSAMTTGAMLGWYGAARTITNTLVMPGAILVSAIFPRISRVGTNLPMLRTELEAAVRPLLVLGVLVAAGTVLFADVAIGLI